MGYKLALLGTVAVLVQTISSQYIGNSLNGPVRTFNKGPLAPNIGAGSYGPNRGFNGIGPNLAGPNPVSGCAASTGGSFSVTSGSPIPPTGVSVLSENLAIEGPLAVGGNLPFLGTVGLEGAMPAGGAGSVSYGCGSGAIGISSENTPGFAGPYSLAGANPVNALAGAPIATPAVSSFGRAGSIGPSSISLAGPLGSGVPLGSGIGSRFGGFNGLRN